MLSKGDKVRVNKDLIMGKEYGSYVFTMGMTPLRNKTVIIDEVIEEDKVFKIAEDKCNKWTREMFEV